MIGIKANLDPTSLKPATERVFSAAAPKIVSLNADWDDHAGSPTITRHGRYAVQPWSDWTRGFQFGLALLGYDALGDDHLLEIGLDGIRNHMLPHLTHSGVHDHGFTIVSSYGNLWRLIREERIQAAPWMQDYVEMALQVSGAIQARRWTELRDDLGFIYSAFGPHCLFADTIRTMRSLAIAHQLGHVPLGEQDAPFSLLRRMLQHCETTARFAVYRGENRDIYDVAGRVSHEALFNTNNGTFHCPNTQQGFSPFSTWTRAQSWVLLGFAELAEWFIHNPDLDISGLRLSLFPDTAAVVDRFVETARVVAEHVIAHACSDGVPYWDTAAPGLNRMGEDYAERPADPFNPHEPVDSPSAAINAQGFLRLANVLEKKDDPETASRYRQTGLTIAETLFDAPYLSEDPSHQGLLLHSVYNRPHGWDTILPGEKVPNGESAMWGDYHYLELAVLIHRLAVGKQLRSF